MSPKTILIISASVLALGAIVSGVKVYNDNKPKK